ncbi:MAG: Stp1/IreP family PP2C-type Ser/Thr phosphatase [Lachnospiraceae bacterium]|nr:Stp1/IreP family PP2C-type Ser/Thr phosphatase [Lachnospiraceae bacterium]MEE3460496.1 Stp1/IreP family PP2C-type Ser/Thr phosphatase [Lachnospiraceae bacterium]
MRSAARTDIGEKRSMNQDYIFASEEPVGSFPNLFIVADGMGGHKAGDHASHLCVESVCSYLKKAEPGTPVSLFEEAVHYANEQVIKESLSSEDYTGMGTTLVIASIIGDTLYVSNVGDSRLYLITDKISQLTRDHSLVEEMVLNGRLSESQARFHPQKNIITRAIGIDINVTPDFFEKKLNPGDRFMMCSDGLSNMVDNYDIQYIIKHNKDVNDAVNELVDRANENGGTDNISCILVEF